MFTLDSRNSLGISDRYGFRDTRLQPGPGEILRISTRCRVLDDPTDNSTGDVGIFFTDADSNGTLVYFGPDFVSVDSPLGNEVEIIYPVTLGEFHDYRLETADLLSFRFYVDDALAFSGNTRGGWLYHRTVLLCDWRPDHRSRIANRMGILGCADRP